MTTLLNGNDVIMVDDSASERALARQCYQLAGLQNPWREFGDGLTFLEHMRALPSPAQFPALVLLDINMPRLDGFQVLAFLREDARYGDLPVLMMLTNSSRPEDKARALELGAANCTTKPEDIDAYVAVFARLSDRFR